MIKNLLIVLAGLVITTFFSIDKIDSVYAMCGMPGCTMAHADDKGHEGHEKHSVTEVKQDTKKYFESKKYVCPMGHEEKEKVGKCSKCDMRLEPKKVYKTYACPEKICDYHQNKPGKCPEHNKKLKESEIKFHCPKCDAELDFEELKTKPVK